MKAFLSYEYTSEGNSLADNLRPLLESLGLTAVTGKRVQAASKLSRQIEMLIDECDVLIALDSGDGLSNWVLSEASYARGRRLPVICITSTGQRPTGLLADDFFVSLARGDLHAATSLVESIGRIRLGDPASKKKRQARNLALIALAGMISAAAVALLLIPPATWRQPEKATTPSLPLAETRHLDSDPRPQARPRSNESYFDSISSHYNRLARIRATAAGSIPVADRPPVDAVQPVPEWAKSAVVVLPDSLDVNAKVIEQIAASISGVPVRRFALMDSRKKRDLWIRDIAPFFVVDASHMLVPVVGLSIGGIARGTQPGLLAHFEAIDALLKGTRPLHAPIILEGGDLQYGDGGLCVTSSQVLAVNHLSSDELDWVLRRYFGCARILILEPLRDMYGPQHIDIIVRTLPGGLLMAEYPPEDLAQAEATRDTDAALLRRDATVVTQANLEVAIEELAGTGLRIIRVPMPRIEMIDPSEGIDAIEGEGINPRRNVKDSWLRRNASFPATKKRPLYRSFLNSLIVRAGKDVTMVVPTFSVLQKDDAVEARFNVAKERIREAWPGIGMVGVEADFLAMRGGGIRCATWTIPVRP